MTYTTLERHDIEVPMPVCMAGMIAVLSRVAAACRTAPWSEDMTCLSHDASSAAFRWKTKCRKDNFQSDQGIGQTHPIAGRTPQKVGSALSYSAGHGYGPVKLWTCRTLLREDHEK